MSPEVQGEAPLYLPIYIQGLLNNNFGKYSAVNLIDRQNLDKIISEQNMAANGRYSDRDFVRIGNLINAQYFLFGTIQRLSGNRFSLQLSVTEASTGVRKATFMKEGTLAQLEGRSALINEATADLLTQLGVQLTEAGRRELLAGNISAVQAQAGLARGITAQAGGSEAAALLNFAQAVSFDPTQLEALSRLDTISTIISGGTISQRITNDIQARDQWLAVFKETAKFFNEHPPFEIIFDPNLIQIGETDFSRRTATLGMRIALDSSKTGFDALNAILEGLINTGRREAWGFSGWPLMDISPRTSGTVVFSGKKTLSYKVDAALVNEKGKRIGNGSVTLNTEPIIFAAGDGTVKTPFSIYNVVRFANIKAEDLTPTLTIVILAVNGISSSNLATSGFIKVDIGDLDIEIDSDNFNPHVNTVSLSHDGNSFLTGSGFSDGTLKLWNTTTGREIRQFEQTSRVNSVVFSPDNRQILSTSSDGRINLWDLTTGRLIRTFSSYSSFVSFNYDGKQFISGANDGDIKLWDVTTGREIRSFRGHSREVSSAVFISFDQIISGSLDGTIKIWDITNGRVVKTFSGHRDSICSIGVNVDGSYIISGGGNMFSSNPDYTIKLWDRWTGREIRKFTGHRGTINSLAFSPDGTQIISGSADKTIKLWDVTTGRLIRTFSGHIDSLSSVCFTPDGRYIISGSDDTTVKFWDASTGRLIRTIGTERLILYGGGD